MGMPIKSQKFTKTPFKKQADVISALLRTNPIINEDDKVSLNETVGVLTWMNQLQLHWKMDGGSDMPETITRHIFEGRDPVKIELPNT